MAFKDDITKILRAELGEGYERSSLEALKKAYLQRALEPLLGALYEGRINKDKLTKAREDVEEAFAVQQKDLKALKGAAQAKAKTDIKAL